MSTAVERKIALVTGGTSGVGLSLVKELVNKDFSVHFIGTNRKRGEAIEEVLQESLHIELPKPSFYSIGNNSNNLVPN